MMRKLFPAPMTSLGLIAMWLLLNESLSAGHITLAVFFGWLIPLLFAPLRPQRPRIRKPWLLVPYIARIGVDVVASNWEVARDLLLNRHKPVHSAFVAIPLDLRDPSGLGALAMVTTVVPGTVWCELARDGSSLLLHVWDAPDTEAFMEHYKRAYERPLMEIFES